MSICDSISRTIQGQSTLLCKAAKLCIALYFKGFTLSPLCYPVRTTVRELLSHSDNDPIQQTTLCGAVQAGGGSARRLAVTQPLTNNIIRLNDFFRMNVEAEAMGGGATMQGKQTKMLRPT